MLLTGNVKHNLCPRSVWKLTYFQKFAACEPVLANVARVRLIRLFLSVGFTLDEIRRFAPCWQAGRSPDDPVEADVAADFYRRKLADIDAQLRDLQVIRDRLTTQLSELTGAGPACAPTLKDSHEPDPRP